MTRVTRFATWAWIVVSVVGLSSVLVIRPVRSAAPRREGTTSALGGDEIVTVFIGASFCGATKTPGLPQVIERMKQSLRDGAQKDHKRLVTVGVALDWAPEDGIEFLKHFGRFDELHTGRNWLNIGAVDYIWRGVPGTAGLPQVVVLERHVTQEKTGLAVTEDRLLRRLVGADQIREWVNSNTPLP